MEAPEDGGGSGEPGGPSLSEVCAQLLRTRDAGGRLLAGQELLRRLRAPGPGAGAAGQEPELDEAELSQVVDELTSWLPASHSKQSASLLECPMGDVEHGQRGRRNPKEGLRLTSLVASPAAMRSKRCVAVRAMGALASHVQMKAPVDFRW